MRYKKVLLLHRYHPRLYFLLLNICAKMLKISLCLFLIGIAGSIDCTFDYSSDSRCGAKQNYVENVKSSATALCREAKIEKKAANNADFVFTYKNGTGTGFSYGDGGLVAAASVSKSSISSFLTKDCI